jgi:DNA-binding transcriptional MerR regulator
VYIGELAKRTSATPKAIRLYESLGLLGAVARLGVYRVYQEKHVNQVRLIKQAQAMGFKLADVAPALQGRRVDPNWTLLAQPVERRRADIAQDIVRLKRLDRQLQPINVEIRACADLTSPA